VAGLTASAGLAGWVEFALLRRGLNRRIGRTGLDPRLAGRLWAAAAAAAAAGGGVALGLPIHEHPILLAVGVLAVYGPVYLGVASALGVTEAAAFFRRLKQLSGVA
jgi:putative peptidoglycan lipid II flippase